MKLLMLFGYTCFIGMAFSALAFHHGMLETQLLIDLLGLSGLISAVTALFAALICGD